MVLKNNFAILTRKEFVMTLLTPNHCIILIRHAYSIPSHPAIQADQYYTHKSSILDYFNVQYCSTLLAVLNKKCAVLNKKCTALNKKPMQY